LEKSGSSPDAAPLLIMVGDPCICGNSIWHPECYRSFEDYFKTTDYTKENIRNWKDAHDFKATPRFEVTRKVLEERMSDKTD